MEYMKMKRMEILSRTLKKKNFEREDSEEE
jgi:hypothetical protein